MTTLYSKLTRKPLNRWKNKPCPHRVNVKLRALFSHINLHMITNMKRVVI